MSDIIHEQETTKIIESDDPEFIELHSWEFVPTVQTLISEVIYG